LPLALTARPGGSIVVGGRFYGPTVFDRGGAAEVQLESGRIRTRECNEPECGSVSHPAENFFLASYTPMGGFDWVVSARGSEGHNAILDVVALDDGSLATTGWFHGSAVFGYGEERETTLHSTETGGMFVARFDPSGRFVWGASERSGGEDWGFGIASVERGRVVATGGWNAALEGRASDFLLVAYEGLDGERIGDAMATGGLTYGSGVYNGPGDTLIVHGLHEFEAVFGAGSPTETALSSDRPRDFFALYSADLELLWVQMVPADDDGSASIESSFAIGDDRLGIAGTFDGTVTFGAGQPNETTVVARGYDIFVAQFDVEGAFLAVTTLGRAGDGFLREAQGLPDGSVMILGTSTRPMTLGAGGPREVTLFTDDVASELADDGALCGDFVARLDAAGDLLWARAIAVWAADPDEQCEHLARLIALPDGSSVVASAVAATTTLGAGCADEVTIVDEREAPSMDDDYGNTSYNDGFYVMRLSP
jgi:hypothetical protein